MRERGFVMDYNEAKLKLDAIFKQKTVQVEKLKEILDVIDRHKKNVTAHYKEKSINLERRLNQMHLQQKDQVIVVKTKNNIPSVIQVDGIRYIRDASFKGNR